MVKMKTDTAIISPQGPYTAAAQELLITSRDFFSADALTHFSDNSKDLFCSSFSFTVFQALVRMICLEVYLVRFICS